MIKSLCALGLAISSSLLRPSNHAARGESIDMDLRNVFEVSPWTSGGAGWILNMSIKRDSSFITRRRDREVGDAISVDREGGPSTARADEPDPETQESRGSGHCSAI